jgi:hypothetical protein
MPSNLPTRKPGANIIKVNAFDFPVAQRRRGAFSLYWHSNTFALINALELIEKLRYKC